MNIRLPLFRSTLIVLLSFLCGSVNAQEVLWANKVLGFSSEFRPLGDENGYRSKQILGKPNKLPASGDSPCAWTPSNPDGINDEWIKVGFAKAVALQQVAVGENFNPGAISKVYAYTPEGAEFLIYDGKPGRVSEAARILNIYPTQKDIICQSIKIILQPSKVPGENQIDAIGISDNTTPIQAKINLASNLPKDLKRENLGKAINSSGVEVAPQISSDGKTLYFTRANHEENIGIPGNQDIWYSTIGKNNQWTNAVNIGAPLNNAGDNAALGLSSDGKKLYVINKYKPDGTLALGLSYSIHTDAGWGFPKEMKVPNLRVNAKNSEMEVAVSPHGNVLVISVQSVETEGRKDLYVSFQKNDNSWSDLVNIGKTINSAADEVAPFLAMDNKTLYFSSFGHSGFGEADIFMSRRLDETWVNWSEPENLGPVFNSEKWDGFFSVPASGEFGYFCSNAKTLGQEDIFRVRLTPEIKPEAVAIITGAVYDAATNKPIQSQVIAEIKGKEETFTQTDYVPSAGDYKLILPAKALYTFTVSHDGYFPAEEDIDLSTETGFRNIKRNLYLQPLKAGQQIRLSSAMFFQSSAEVVPASYKELDRIVAVMDTYKNMEILLEGHTDNQGEIQKNIKLSEDRVVEVKKYLASKGIDPKRIQTKAWGPSKPIASNETEQLRQKNRRVEFTILKI